MFKRKNHLKRHIPADIATASRRAEAANPATPPDRLRELAEDPERKVRVAVAKNFNTPLQTLKLMTCWRRIPHVNNDKERRLAAKHPKNQPAMLQKMAHDPDVTVRRYVAECGNTPPTALQYLADDPDDEVRQHVACNPNTHRKRLLKR